MSHVERFIEVSGEVRLPYVEQGDRSGIPVVFLHGVTDSWRAFEPVLAHLPASIRAFAPTQRGHGTASRPAAGYRFRDLAGDLARFLDAVGVPAALIVGHSMGAGVAQRFALDHPGRTRGLVLLGAFADLTRHAGVRALWESDVSKLEDPIDPGFARAFQESTLAQPVPEAFLRMVVAESLCVPARVWRSLFEGFLEADQAAELCEIEAPTRIVWGDRDALCSRADQEALLAAIAGSRLAVYAGAGHAMHWEEPERVAADVVRFAVELDRSEVTSFRAHSAAG